MTKTVNQRFDPELPVEWIQPHPDNPNEGDEAALEESIDEHGFVGAVMVRQIDEWEYQLIGGEHRWKDRKKRGIETIPAIIVEDMSDEAALKMLLADNEITRRGKYNVPKLTEVLRKLPNTRGTGFPMDALAAHEKARADKAAAEVAKSFVREYALVITCESEDEQAALFETLQREIEIAPERIRVASI